MSGRVTVRLAYERSLEAAGTPWALELPSGERLYTGKVVILAPAETVLTPGPGRFHGYLEITGEVDFGEAETTIRG